MPHIHCLDFAGRGCRYDDDGDEFSAVARAGDLDVDALLRVEVGLALMVSFVVMLKKIIIHCAV